MRRLLIILAVLAVVGVGGWFGDAYVRDQAQGRVAATLTTELDATGVDVQLGGAPFSLVVFTRAVPSAALTADTVVLPISGQQVEVSDLEVTTGQVVLAGDELQAHQVVGTATLGYDQLAKLAGAPVSYAGNGRLGFTYQVTLLGRTVSLGVSAKPVLDASAQTIQLTEPVAEIGGAQVDLPIDQQVIDSLVKPIDVSLDYGLQLTKIIPDTEDLHIAFSGDDVRVPVK